MLLQVCTVLCLVSQSWPTLCDPMDCSPLGSSVRGDSPGKNTGVGSYSLLQGIFLTQGWNLGLLHCWKILYCLSHQGNIYFKLEATSLWWLTCSKSIRRQRLKWKKLIQYGVRFVLPYYKLNSEMWDLSSGWAIWTQKGECKMGILGPFWMLDAVIGSAYSSRPVYF